MDDLILPGGKRPKPIRVLEHDAHVSALVSVAETGSVTIQTSSENLILGAGGWIVVPAELWASMAQRVMEADQLLEASNKAGRRARKMRIQMQRDRRN